MKTIALYLLGYLILFSPEIALAGDTSADTERWVRDFDESTAVIVRLEIGGTGEENTATADVRLYSGRPVRDDSSISEAWSESMALMHPHPDSETYEDIDSDSSTWGFRNTNHFAPRRFRRGGWRAPFYFSSFRPFFYNRGFLNYFGTPRVSPFRFGRPFRYYYFPRW